MNKGYNKNYIYSICGEKLTNIESKERLLYMLSSFDSFCQSHNLKYFLLYGTLLGAVRHKGFIPWDDDVDVGMPRSDYDFLINNYNSISDDIDIVSINNSGEYYHPFPFAKLSDKKTITISSNEKLITGKGQFIDVFPLDYLPDKFLNKKTTIFRLKILELIRGLGLRKICKSSNIKYKVENLLTRLLSHLDFTKLANRINCISKKCSSIPTAKLSTLVSPLEKLYWDSMWFEELERVPFESITVFIPKEYHNILTVNYGNYLLLPPEDKQVSPHDTEVYWKK